MSETTLEKKIPAPLREKGQYVLAFGVVAVMLYVAGFPFFVILFLGFLFYFVSKIFSSAARIETRRIFEFYLSANEILRDDERRWYGFEIREAISRGENIVRSMSEAPPLMHFALGALYHKAGDHGSAVRNLSFVLEDPTSQESSIVFPTAELRDYVRLLRKIECQPAEAPLMSGAVRSLERKRKNLGTKLLEDSRAKTENDSSVQNENRSQETGSFREMLRSERTGDMIASDSRIEVSANVESGEIFQHTASKTRAKSGKRSAPNSFSDRKSISEVLHDIYDKKIH